MQVKASESESTCSDLLAGQNKKIKKPAKRKDRSPAAHIRNLTPGTSSLRAMVTSPVIL
jgi:hypothetical protein